jgi:hypothetical protein
MCTTTFLGDDVVNLGDSVYFFHLNVKRICSLQNKILHGKKKKAYIHLIFLRMIRMDLTEWGKKDMGIEERCHLSLSSLSCCRNIGIWSVSKDNHGPDFIVKGQKILYSAVSKSSHVGCSLKGTLIL